MKKYLPIILLLSFLTFLVGGTEAVISYTQARHKSSASLADFNTDCVIISATGRANGGLMNIHHRSALPNETIVLTCRISEIAPFKGENVKIIPGYYSRWNEYCSSRFEFPPPQQAYLSPFGLRAPPLAG